MNGIAHLISGPWLMHERMASILYEQYMRGRLSLPAAKDEAKKKSAAKLAGMKVTYIGQAVWSTVMVKHPSGKNIAIMPVIGTLTKRGDMCSYGMRDYMAEIELLNANDDIAAIVMNMEGPGGTVDGTPEFGMIVAQSKKPVVAFGDYMVASADYWIASQAAWIIGNKNNPTEFGSIGVFCIHEYYGKYIEDNIGEIRIIRAPQSTDKILSNPFEPLPKQEEKEMIADLKGCADQFLGAVKAGRGDRLTQSEKVWGTGKMYKNPEAIEIGLIDAEGSLMDAINKAAELSGGSTEASDSKNATAKGSHKQINKNPIMNTKEVARKVSSFFTGKKKAAKAAAATDAVAAEEETVPMWTEEMTFNTDGSGDGAFCLHPDNDGTDRKFETKIDNNTGNEPPVDPAITEDDNWALVAEAETAPEETAEEKKKKEDDEKAATLASANSKIAKLNTALKTANASVKTLTAKVTELEAKFVANEKKPAASATTVVAKKDRDKATEDAEKNKHRTSVDDEVDKYLGKKD